MGTGPRYVKRDMPTPIHFSHGQCENPHAIAEGVLVEDMVYLPEEMSNLDSSEEDEPESQDSISREVSAGSDESAGEAATKRDETDDAKDRRKNKKKKKKEKPIPTSVGYIVQRAYFDNPPTPAADGSHA